ncbi:MAG: HDOD domain-containing protein [Marinobacter sp.]|uniref:HDOD domain-containing protein n=1 Tax=Marinobacter sp. TaxID=50741 RepID=UPI00299E7B36|nr:HDOD domain-containing protein [Marinobacter sp.]MDX1636240.1 HDOD domain-containing protein [Marinobacter sp.]
MASTTDTLPTRMNGTRAWVDYLSKVELPVLANTLRRINELTDSNSSTVNQLAEVILNDAQLTSQVLRLSNTVFYNQTRTQVGTVSRAITLIGFDAVKSMAISSLIVDTLLARSERSHLLKCLARALHAAVQARCLLPRRNEQALEEVFIGALLMNIGELAFWSCDTEQADELEQRLGQDEPAVAAQKTVLKTTFAEITRGLVEAWALGPFIRDVVSAGRPNSKAASLVRHSVELARLSESGWRGADMDKLMETLGGELEEAPATVRDQVRINAGEAAKIAVSLGIPQVQALLPGADTGAEETTKSPQPAAPDPELQLQILRELAECLTAKPDINQVCQLVTEGIQRALGMQRVALLMSDRSGTQLVPRKVLGLETEGWRDGFVIERNRKTTLNRLLSDHECTLYKPAKDAQRAGFDPWVGKVPALVGPLMAKGRIVGLFYADNAGAGSAPSAGQLTAFSHFVRHAQLCLTLLSVS